jgi:predicted short-subunit dehydrogenase-like oxidoreductase (DUF2520 family)
MKRKPRIAIVGTGNLARALALSLRKAGYDIEIMAGRAGSRSNRQARQLGRELQVPSTRSLNSDPLPDVVWFCVPDSAISEVAKRRSVEIDWRGRVALHSSGALTSDELNPLRQSGAAVASLHPLMTFVRGSRPSLAGVSMALEGDLAAVRAAEGITKSLGSVVYQIRKKRKAAYHAWGTFVSPLFTALLATSERVAALAGISRKSVRRRAVPILLQTLANYAALGPAQGFSGPIIRGDTGTIKRHLKVLHEIPAGQEVYRALAGAALDYLPARNKLELRKVLGAGKANFARKPKKNRHRDLTG